MFEITYRDLEDGFTNKGIFFSKTEWNAFQEDSAEAGCPIVPIWVTKVDPMEWYKTKSSSYERSYVVEVMAIAIMGQEWASQYDKWRDQEKALKELGII